MADIAWQDVIKNWNFTLSGDSPSGLEETVPTVVTTISGAYEITTISFGFTGNAPYHQQKFTGTFSFSIESVANLYSIAVSSDDTATLNAGGLSVSSSLFHPASASTESWIQTPPETLAVSGNYETIGGPYFLLITIELKRSLREVYFEAEFNTPEELEGADAAFGKTEETKNAREERLKELLTERNIFGCGENVKIMVRNYLDSNIELRESPASVSGACRLENGIVYLMTRQKENGTATGTLTFSDGEKLDFSAEIKVPKYEAYREVSEEEFKTISENKIPLIDYEGHPFKDGHYYVIQVLPKNVSFFKIYHWEDDCPESKSGLFNLLSEKQTKHTPTPPYQLNDYNACADRAYYAVNFSEQTILAAEEDADGHVGVLTWLCPVRWSFDNPNSDEAEKKNSELPSDGNLPTRIQTITLDRSGSEILVRVAKDFPRA